MAFCAKCGTVLDASGVCPVCGYVLNRDKYPLPEDQGGNRSLENTVQLSDLSKTVNSSVDFVPAVEPAADDPSDVDRADLAEGAISGDSAASEAISNPQEQEAGDGPQSKGVGPQGTGSGPQGQGPDASPQGQGYGPQTQDYGPQGYGPQGPGDGPQGPGYGPQGPGYGPQGPGMGAQGQPYYGRPYPQKNPSEFGANLVQWFLGIFRKDPTEIFESVSHSKSPVWIIYMTVYAIFGALALACSIGRVATLFGNIGILSGLDHAYHGGSVRLAVSAFFGGLLFFAVSLFLAMLVVWVLFTIIGKHLSFMAICNVTAVAYIPVILATVFSFICSFSIFTAVIGGLVSTVAGIATMILLYGAITRLSDRRGQMIWLYIAAQTVLKILIGIVAFVLVAAIIMGALMVSSYRYW